MKNIILGLGALLFGLSACSQKCDYCGVWNYEKYEYAGRITTNCAETSKLFVNSSIYLDKDVVSVTYNIDNAQVRIENPEIELLPANENNLYAIVIKQDGIEKEKFYFISPDVLYISRDGCNFYFTR